eukprot:gene6059-7713_t
MALSAGDQQGEKEFYLGAFGAYEIGDGQRESKNGCWISIGATRISAPAGHRQPP